MPDKMRTSFFREKLTCEKRGTPHKISGQRLLLDKSLQEKMKPRSGLAGEDGVGFDGCDVVIEGGGGGLDRQTFFGLR